MANPAGANRQEAESLLPRECLLGLNEERLRLSTASAGHDDDE